MSVSCKIKMFIFTIYLLAVLLCFTSGDGVLAMEEWDGKAVTGTYKLERERSVISGTITVKSHLEIIGIPREDINGIVTLPAIDGGAEPQCCPVTRTKRKRAAVGGGSSGGQTVAKPCPAEGNRVFVTQGLNAILTLSNLVIQNPGSGVYAINGAVSNLNLRFRFSPMTHTYNAIYIASSI